MRRTVRMAMAGMLAAAALSGGATAAVAESDDVIAEGLCSGRSDWKLKAGPENGQLEVEFEVDSNVVGQVWGVRLLDNGTEFFRGVKRTTAPSGSFEVRRFIPNQAGTDTIQGQAKNPDTGEVCSGTIVI